MSKILGLDLGTKSIGWAIVDTDNNKIIDAGCIVRKEPITEIEINGKVIFPKSTKCNKRNPLLFRRIYRQAGNNHLIFIVLLLQIATALLFITNLDDWRFWFSISFSVFLTLLTSINSLNKNK